VELNRDRTVDLRVRKRPPPSFSGRFGTGGRGAPAEAFEHADQCTPAKWPGGFPRQAVMRGAPQGRIALQVPSLRRRHSGYRGLHERLNAPASTSSPSWMSIALRVLPSRLALRGRWSGSFPPGERELHHLRVRLPVQTIRCAPRPECPLSTPRSSRGRPLGSAPHAGQGLPRHPPGRGSLVDEPGSGFPGRSPASAVRSRPLSWRRLVLFSRSPGPREARPRLRREAGEPRARFPAFVFGLFTVRSSSEFAKRKRRPLTICRTGV